MKINAKSQQIALNKIANNNYSYYHIVSFILMVISMYVCICNGVTDKQIIKQAQSGASTLRDLQESLGVATNCGKCAKLACAILAEHSVFASHEFTDISRHRPQPHAVAA